MRLARLTTAEAMHRLVPEWQTLWECDPNATPFQSPAWLLAWWRHFGTERPLVLEARLRGRLVGVLPLYLLHERGCRKLLPIGISLSDYVDAVIASDLPETGRLLLAGALAEPGWDECYLPDLRDGAGLLSAPCPDGIAERCTATVPCPVLALPETGALISDIVPRKTLRDLRQGRARSAALGPIAVEAVDPDSPAETRDAIVDDCFRLHEKRWRERGESGLCADEGVRAFYRDAAAAMHRAGMLRLYRLRIGGAVVAAYYGLYAKQAAYAYFGGFDPDYARVSPGAQLVAHAIEEAISEGARAFHFLRGDESYKYAWGARDQWNTARTFRAASKC
ncbi:MAG: GNAT family N-acetyltransferase [Alphaproteobacteria bacterium]|nr:GNAT family N-acetyltransferase [Alphaproteobacteria bacterium]